MVSARHLVWTVLVCASRVACSFIRVDDSQTFSDENRSGIQYGSGWTQWKSTDPRDERYGGTYSSTQTAGARLMFSFRGTSISYYADKTPSSGTVLLSIDGDQHTPIQVNSSNVQHQQGIFGVSGLAPGDHQIVIGAPASNGTEPGIVGLDFFGVTPLNDNPSYVPQNLGPGAWSIPLDATIIDDGNPAIHYTGDSWLLYDIVSSGPAPLFYNGTQHSSTVPGSSLSFTFSGTGVWYFSDDSLGNANVLVSVDGGEGVVVGTSTGATSISQKMFWSKTGLVDGEHVVTVTHNGKQGQYANLDFFAYLPSPNTSNPASTKRIPVAVIVGSVVGGVLGLVLILAGLLFMRNRRRATKEETQSTDGVKTGVHHLTLGKTASRGSEVTLDEEKFGDDKALV